MNKTCKVDHELLKHSAEQRERHAYGIGEMLGLILFNCRWCHTTLSVAQPEREVA